MQRALPTRHSAVRQVLAASVVCWFAQLVCLQSLTAQTPTQTPLTVTGTVVDAVSRQPVFRALVRLGQRAVLTDAEGHFSFAAADAAASTITASKPGYSFGESPEDPREIGLKPEQMADPVVLRLYPEAIVKGLLTNPEGEPLPNIPINALRQVSNGSGRRWVTTGVTRTDTHGQFRLPLPAGNYRISSAFTRVSPSSAILPCTLPPASASPTDQGMRVRSGEQLSLDLRPVVAPLLEVKAHLDVEDVRDLGALTAVSSDGESFPVPFRANEDSGITMSLPPGRYTLEARGHGSRNESFSQASLNLPQSATQPVSVDLHFSSAATLAVELSIDEASLTAAATAGQALAPPSPRTLGLSLEPGGRSPRSGSDPVRLNLDRDGSTSFAAGSGTYRLRARPNQSWYIVSATAGGADILGRDLVVNAGAGSTPIQLVVSNQMAGVSGTVTLNGRPAACWLYLVATTPTATPVLTLRSGDDGSFTNSLAPPGVYQAIAFERRRTVDPEDPEALAPFSTHLASVTLKPGEKLNALEVEAVPDAELRP